VRPGPDERSLRRTRLLVWGGVAALAVAAGVVLLVMRRDDRKASLAPASVRMRVVDPAGAPVRDARVFVGRAAGEPPAVRMDPGEGVLTIEGGWAPHAVLAGARGRRVRFLEDVRADGDLVLERGIEVRVDVQVAEGALRPNERLLVRVRPVADARGLLPGDGRVTKEDLVAWMATTGAEDPLVDPLTRPEFGLALSLEQAARGFLVPAPGRYAVHWGILDLGVGTFFTLEERSGKEIGVVDAPERATTRIAVTEPQVEATREGLARWVERLRAGEAAPEGR
jgi:hypothetical protein